jgi:hypothetical protein
VRELSACRCAGGRRPFSSRGPDWTARQEEHRSDPAHQGCSPPLPCAYCVSPASPPCPVRLSFSLLLPLLLSWLWPLRAAGE